MRTNFRTISTALGIGILLSGIVTKQAKADFVINLEPAAGMDAQALAGFQKAAGLWTSAFSDNITVNIAVDFTSLGSNILGQTDTSDIVKSYSSVRNALVSDKTSADDALAVSHLQAGNSLSFVTNNTAGQATLDNDKSANNAYLDLSTANAKALGLLDAQNTGIDASITFSSDFNFDFNPDDGISNGTYDFVGVAAHEIGHALGFLSGVDTVDSNPGVDLNNYAVFNTLDLFRYSSTVSSLYGNGVQDLSYGSNSYFSLDGGATAIAQFSTGANFGDGYQASHWKDGLGLGIMDPTVASSELLSSNMTSNDVRALDVIGYNRRLSAGLPEPTTFSFLALALMGGTFARRRRV